MSRLAMVLASQGDPGIGTAIVRVGRSRFGQLVRRVAPRIARALPGVGTAIAVGGAAADIGGAIGSMGPRPVSSTPVRIPTSLPPGVPASSPLGQVITRGRVLTRGGHAAPAGHRRRRRMNPANFRALQRGLRRLKSFSKLARKILKTEHHFKTPRKGTKFPSSRRRRRSR